MSPKVLWLFLPALAVTAAAETPVKARLKMPGRPDQQVELVGRSATGDIHIRVGAQGEIGYKPSDLGSLEFEWRFDPAAVQQLYNGGQYGDVARVLKPALEPIFPYLRVTNNAMAHIRRWLHCLYWDGQYAETITAARRLDKDIADPAIQRELRALTAAALVGAGRTNEAAAVLRALEPVAKTGNEAAAYWYATAQLHTAQQHRPEAQEAIAQLIAFRRRDPDWMPPALYLSAQGYAQAGQPAVARQIVKELNTLYPRNRWTKQAAAWEAKLPPVKEPTPVPAIPAAQTTPKP